MGLAQGHVAFKWQNQSPNPCLLTLSLAPTLYATMLSFLYMNMSFWNVLPRKLKNFLLFYVQVYVS